jgi:probable DNA metabolism protein
VLTATLARPDDFDGWRAAARRLAVVGIPPDAVVWQVGDTATDLLGGGALPAVDAPMFTVPKDFIAVAKRVICHRDPERFALLYTALTALRTRPKLLDDAADPLVRRIYDLDKSVRRDIHKMRAFVRFREVPDTEGERFAAWFEPEHHIVRLNAGFFARRFANMRWSILTPDECVHWDGALTFTPGATRADAPGGDPLEETWRTYFASIFNPARLKVKAMTAEMPKKYWKNLPEASLVPGLIAGAGERTRMMIDASDAAGMSNAAVQASVPAAAWPRTGDGGPADALAALRDDAAQCKRCLLFGPATQTVFGEGPADARLVFVGEQPGDSEDLAGRPFIGPAGQMFDRALAAAGIDRARTYVTNAVKHFKFEQRGKRRIHSKPDISEIDACRWWVDHERAAIKPLVTVALGASAARSLTGKAVTISRERGRPLTLADGSEAWITVHPSFLLRIEDKAAAAVEYDRFVADLIAIRERLAVL